MKRAALAGFRLVPTEADDAARRTAGKSVWKLWRGNEPTDVSVVHPHDINVRRTPAHSTGFWYIILGPFPAVFVRDRDFQRVLESAVRERDRHFAFVRATAVPKRGKPSKKTSKRRAKR